MLETTFSYANAVLSNEHHALHDIRQKSKNIAVYQRDIEFLNKELKQLEDQFIECRANGTIEEILTVLKEYFKWDLPKSPILFEDISDQLKEFEKITQVSSFRLLLTTVNTNMCRKFHTDINDLRLLCTYIGQGTLWLPDEIFDLKALKAGGDNQEIVLDKEHIQQANTGDVVILKGALYPDANPILHRSPSIEENGESRLLLRIDTNESLIFL